MSRMKEKSKRYTRCLKVFQSIYGDRSILEKNYEITLIRGLIIYFVYSENEDFFRSYKEKITFKEIAEEFGLERTSVLKAYNRIEEYVKDWRLLNTCNERQRRTFQIFFYLFNKKK